ncbi:MAG: cutinase family protein [Corynebacterium sp.]|nr:cutinase family protein [Corynebacterium sp.]
MRKPRTAVACLTLAIAAQGCVIPAAAVPLWCTPVHVVQAAGTGYSTRDAATDPTALYTDAWNPGDSLTTAFTVHRVSTYSVAYPASLGRLNVFTRTPMGRETTTYGESVAAGVNSAVDHLTRRARTCPGTVFVLIGYSQGASIIGDVAARIGAGQVAGVSADDVAAVVLIADPGRSPLPDPATPPPVATSRLYGPIPPGTPASGGEILNGGGSGELPDRVGLTGSRPTSLLPLYGKVLSLCHASDMACSIPQEPLIRGLADYANRVEINGPVDAVSAGKISALLDAVGRGVPAQQAIAESGVSVLQLPALAAAALEAIGYSRIVTAATRPELPLPQLLALVAAAAAPNLAYTGTSPRLFGPALDDLAARVEPIDATAGALLQLVAAVYHALTTLETVYALGATPRHLLQEAARDAARRILAAIIDATGTRPAVEDPANAQLVEAFTIAGDFGNTHISYFDGAGYAIDGLHGDEFAERWLETIIGNVLTRADSPTGSPIGSP